MSGFKRIGWIDARTKMPLAGKVVRSHKHEVLSLRALVTQARTTLAGDARLHQVVFEKGFWAGVNL